MSQIIDAGVAAEGDDYLRLRAESTREDSGAREAMAATAALDMVGARALVARAWLGWLEDPALYRRVMESFEIEEASPKTTLSGRPSSPDRLAQAIAARVGPEAAPLLAEVLWKTGRAWPRWRREACLLALERLDDILAETALMDLCLLLDDEQERARAVAILVRANRRRLKSRLRALRTRQAEMGAAAPRLDELAAALGQ